MEIVQNAPDPVNPAEAVDTAAGESALADLIDRAHQDQSDSRPLMTPKDGSPRKKMGRPRKNPDDPRWQGGSARSAEPEGPPPPQGPPPFDATPLCKDTFKMLSRVIVAQTGVEACALQQDEIDTLGAAWGMVCNQYMPVVLSQYGPLIAACSVSATVALRLKSTVDAEIERRKAERAKDVPNEESAA